MAAAANSKPGERDHYTFGFGRRVCPGIHLASIIQSFIYICVLAYIHTSFYICRLKWKCSMSWCESLLDVQ